jgi:hypothetical protein
MSEVRMSEVPSTAIPASAARRSAARVTGGGAAAPRLPSRPPVPSLAMAGRVLIVALALAIPLAAAPMADHLRPAATLR